MMTAKRNAPVGRQPTGATTEPTTNQDQKETITMQSTEAGARPPIQAFASDEYSEARPLHSAAADRRACAAQSSLGFALQAVRERYGFNHEDAAFYMNLQVQARLEYSEVCCPRGNLCRKTASLVAGHVRGLKRLEAASEATVDAAANPEAHERYWDFNVGNYATWTRLLTLAAQHPDEAEFFTVARAAVRKSKREARAQRIATVVTVGEELAAELLDARSGEEGGQAARAALAEVGHLTHTECETLLTALGEALSARHATARGMSV